MVATAPDAAVAVAEVDEPELDVDEPDPPHALAKIVQDRAKEASIGRVVLFDFDILHPEWKTLSL